MRADHRHPAKWREGFCYFNMTPPRRGSGATASSPSTPLRTAFRAVPSSPHPQTIKEHLLCDTDEVIEIILLDALNSVTTTSNCLTTTGTRAFARFAQHSAPCILLPNFLKPLHEPVPLTLAQEFPSIHPLLSLYEA
jgi:hypothetical protein